MKVDLFVYAHQKFKIEIFWNYTKRVIAVKSLIINNF